MSRLTERRQNFTPSPNEEGPLAEQMIDLRRFGYVIIQRRWLVISCVLLALVMAGLYLYRARPVYESFTRLTYEPPKNQMIGFSESNEKGNQPDEILTQIEIVRSQRVIQRVTTSLGLDKEEAAPERDLSLLAEISEFFVNAKNELSRRLVSYQIDELDPEEARARALEDWLRNSVHVSQVPDTRIIEIRVRSDDKDIAASVAEEFARQYILSLQEETRDAFKDASTWFTEQLGEAKTNLANAEQDLQNYKGENDVRVLQQNLEIATNTMKGINSDIQIILNKLAELAATKRAAESDKLQRALLADDARYATLLNKLKEKELDQVALVMENTENHPSVVRINREIEVLTSQVNTACQELVNEISAKVDIQEINLEGLRDRLKKQEERVQSIQEEMIQYRVLEREVESNREIYTALLDRSKEVAVRSDISAPTVTILEHAKPAVYPSSPKIMRTIALFAILGLFIGVGLVVVADKLDCSIKDPREIESRFGLPTLGTIPFLKEGLNLLGRRKSGHSPLVTQFEPKSGEAEAFRVLRTALQYSHADKPPQVLLITSAFAQEGKSTIAANLAISYAQRGDRVLLIDCDLKRSTMHRVFEIPKEPGLSDHLTGQKAWKDVVIQSPVENLDLLPAGPITPSPTELLESKTMAEMLQSARERYSIIVIDSAPLTGLADSLVLTQAVDGICLIVSRGRTPVEALGKTVGLLDQIEAPLLGVVYNVRERRASRLRERGGYYYYGKYGYGYGTKSD